MITLTDKQVDDVIDALAGTCIASVEEAINGYCDMDISSADDEIASASLEAIYEGVFMCEECGWWMLCEEMAEDVEGEICRECEESHNDD